MVLDASPPPSAVVPMAAGGGGVPTIPPEHLLLGSVGSYFWHSGTRVGGWAQLPLQRKLFAALCCPRHGRMSHRHGLQLLSVCLLA